MLTVILTGGASRRMGADKASLSIRDRTLAEVLIERYSAVGKVVLSVARTEDWSKLPVETLPDVYPGMGPLNGIVSAFLNYDTESVFLTAVDLPFGDAKLADYLHDNLENYDACVIMRRDGRLEPTFAAYSSSCLNTATECLKSGVLSFKGLLEKLRVKYVHEEDIKQFELDKVLFNMNTPEDYALVMEEYKWK